MSRWGSRSTVQRRLQTSLLSRIIAAQPARYGGRAALILTFYLIYLLKRNTTVLDAALAASPRHERFYSAPTTGSSTLARRIAARIVAAIDNAIIACIGNGAGIAVANLPCVAATHKKLIANRRIFEQILIALRCDEFGE